MSFSLADVGSGGGLIGIPIKIACPDIGVTLIEPVQRKFDFLNFVTVQLGLKAMKVSRDSAEKYRQKGAGAFDAAIARALAPLENSLQLGLPLVRSKGYFLLYQSQPVNPTPQLQAALAKDSARLLQSVPYRLPAESKERFLAVFEKN